jgi:hypothetical protein
MSPATRDGAVRSPPLVRTLRWVLYALLIVAAALTLVGLPELQREVAAGRFPSGTLAIPPAVLAIFIAAYGAYRFVLVRAGRYPAGKAFVQVGVMVLVLGVVAGLALDRRRVPAAEPVDLGRALGSPDAGVRAMAAELLRHRSPETTAAQAGRLVELLGDPSAEVRHQAHETLVVLAGKDVGDGPGAADRWRAHLRTAGLLP